MTKCNTPVGCCGRPVQKLVDHRTVTNLASSFNYKFGCFVFEGNLAGQGYPYPAKYDYKYDQYKESNKSGLKDKHKIVTMKPKKIEKASMIN